MRELHADERAILEFLLSRPFPGRDELLAQVDHVVVTKERLGDPTIDLEVDRTIPPMPGYEGRYGHLAEWPEGPADGTGRDAKGVEVGVVIHTNDGYLSELEFYPQHGAPYGRPTLDSMEFIEWNTTLPPSSPPSHHA